MNKVCTSLGVLLLVIGCHSQQQPQSRPQAGVEEHVRKTPTTNYHIDYEKGFIYEAPDKYKLYLVYKNASDPSATDSGAYLDIYISCDKKLNNVKSYFFRRQMHLAYGKGAPISFTLKQLETPNPTVRFAINSRKQNIHDQFNVYYRFFIQTETVKLQWVDSKKEFLEKGGGIPKKYNFDW